MNRVVVILCLAGVLSSTAWANLITNGGFEADGLAANYAQGIWQVPTGWKSTGDKNNDGVMDGGWAYMYRIGISNNSNGWALPKEGNVSVGMSGNMNPTGGCALYQTFAVEAGEEYDVAASAYRPIGVGNNLQVTVFDGAPAVDSAAWLTGTELVSSGLVGVAGEWYDYTGKFTATSDTATIMLYGRWDWSFFDGVSVTAVPEPATMCALMVGALLIRRRRKHVFQG